MVIIVWVLNFSEIYMFKKHYQMKVQEELPISQKKKGAYCEMTQKVLPKDENKVSVETQIRFSINDLKQQQKFQQNKNILKRKYKSP